mgnify:CR=1
MKKRFYTISIFQFSFLEESTLTLQTYLFIFMANFHPGERVFFIYLFILSVNYII